MAKVLGFRDYCLVHNFFLKQAKNIILRYPVIAHFPSANETKDKMDGHKH